MEATMVSRIRDRLVVQRQALTNWLRGTPADKRQVRLGPANEQAVQVRLQVLDEAIDRAEHDTLDRCEVCHGHIEPELLEMDYSCCVCMDDLSPEQKRRLESDLELSQQVQQALLPQQVPDIAGLRLAAFSQPARIVSGDYFDFFQFQNEMPGLAIADVVDKGLAASLLMASLQASLRIIVPESQSPADVADRLNSLLIHNVRMTQFMTMFLGRYDPATRILTYANAGHNPPLLYRPQGNGGDPFTWLQPTGAAIGLIEQSEFKTESIALQPGDVLLLYTDGVTDARNPQGEDFGAARLAELVRQISNLSAQDLLRELRLRLQDFTRNRPIEDDTTIIVGKIE
jgi:sigma-B regulation protein RsbU (phosphoserine phosphatase)